MILITNNKPNRYA